MDFRFVLIQVFDTNRLTVGRFCLCKNLIPLFMVSVNEIFTLQSWINFDDSSSNKCFMTCQNRTLRTEKNSIITIFILVKLLVKGNLKEFLFSPGL